MSRSPPGEGDVGSFGDAFSLDELRRRNPIAVSMDLLYLFTTGFFALLFIRGLWPAVIASVPIATLLYFGWRSSVAFFVAQVFAIMAAVAAWYAGIVPL